MPPSTPSAIQTLLTTQSPPKNTPHSTETFNLALQIAHNLKHQHSWTSLKIHTSPLLPRPLLSGVPPQRLYIHPDEQIALLQAQKDEKKNNVGGGGGEGGMPKVEPQVEWVLPSHLREKWTLRRFGETFDAIGFVPGVEDGEVVFGNKEEEGNEEQALSKWRTEKPKRLLLATLDDDSTVVYYIVHDGIVKPRQN